MGLVAGCRGDGDVGVEEPTGGVQPARRDVVARARAEISPHHQERSAGGGDRRRALEPGGGGDGEAVARVDDGTGIVQPGAVDVVVGGTVAGVLPHHEEVGPVPCHLRYELIRGVGRDGDPDRVEHLAGNVDTGAVDVAVAVAQVLPHDQGIRAVRRDSRSGLLAGWRMADVGQRLFDADRRVHNERVARRLQHTGGYAEVEVGAGDVRQRAVQLGARGILHDELSHASGLTVAQRPAQRRPRDTAGCPLGAGEAGVHMQVAGTPWRGGQHDVPLDFAVAGGHALGQAATERSTGNIGLAVPLVGNDRRGRGTPTHAGCRDLEPRASLASRHLQARRAEARQVGVVVCLQQTGPIGHRLDAVAHRLPDLVDV